MNIETNELIRHLRAEEDARHANNLQVEEDRHNQELQLISNLQETISSWEETLKSSKPVEPEPEPEPPRARRGRKPGVPARKPGRPPGPKAVVSAPAKGKDPSVGSPNGYQAVREKIARESAVNCAGEARAWIAKRGKEPFTMDDIAKAIHEDTGLGEGTVKSRLFPFFQHLEEKGQLDVSGEKRNRVYSATDSFEAVKPRPGVSASAPAPNLSAKEAAWRQIRGEMPTPARSSED